MTASVARVLFAALLAGCGTAGPPGPTGPAGEAGAPGLAGPPGAAGAAAARIEADETWTKAASPHLHETDVVVAAGATLTVEAGATVGFAAGRGLLVEGALSAEGTAAAPIVWEGAGGRWAGVRLARTAGASTIAGCVFRDGALVAEGGLDELRGNQFESSPVRLDGLAAAAVAQNAFEGGPTAPAEAALMATGVASLQARDNAFADLVGDALAVVLLGPLPVGVVSAGVELERNTFSHARGNAVQVTSNVPLALEVDDNDVVGTTLSSILVSAFSGGTVVLRDNAVRDSLWAGLSVRAAGALSLVADGNEVDGARTEGIAVLAYDGLTAELTGNTIESSAGAGILLYAGGAATVEARDNAVRGSGEAGLALFARGEGASTFTAADNAVERSAGIGLQLEATGDLAVEATGNAVAGAGSHAIFVRTLGVLTGKVASNSVADPSGDGIAVRDASFDPLQPFRVTDNTVTGTQGNGLSGLSLPSGKASLRGNTVSGCGGQGILWFFTATEGTTAEATLDGNRVARCTGNGVTVRAAAVTVTSASRETRAESNGGQGLSLVEMRGPSTATIDGGTFKANVGNGIAIGNLFTATVRNATVEENVAGGIFMGNVSRAVFLGNTVLRNGGNGINFGGFQHLTAIAEVRYNIVSENGGNGIFWNNRSEELEGGPPTIARNDVEANFGTGIAVSLVTDIIENNIVGNGWGALFPGVSSARRVAGNFVENNITAQHGMDVQTLGPCGDGVYPGTAQMFQVDCVENPSSTRLTDTGPSSCGTPCD